MRSVRHPLFNKKFEKLTPDQQKAARAAFETWKQDPALVGWHHLISSHANMYSAKIGYANRAVALITPDANGEMMACWIWVGSHETFNTDMRQIRQKSVKDVLVGLSVAQKSGLPPTLGKAAHRLNGVSSLNPARPHPAPPKSKRHTQKA